MEKLKLLTRLPRVIRSEHLRLAPIVERGLPLTPIVERGLPLTPIVERGLSLTPIVERSLPLTHCRMQSFIQLKFELSAP